MGISGMMHGYLVFDKEGRQLADFRTWRNTVTERSAAELSELFGFNIPQRWSIAHLDRAILNGEDHIKSIDFIDNARGLCTLDADGREGNRYRRRHPVCSR